MVICEVISCINSNRSRHRVLLNLLRKTGRFGLKPQEKCFGGGIYTSPGVCHTLLILRLLFPYLQHVG